MRGHRDEAWLKKVVVKATRVKHCPGRLARGGPCPHQRADNRPFVVSRLGQQQLFKIGAEYVGVVSCYAAKREGWKRAKVGEKRCRTCFKF
jgi:hypothetical protein